MQSVILKSIIIDIAASIIFEIASRSLVSSFRKIRRKRFWRKVLTRFFAKIESAYSGFEKSEKEKLLLLDEDFLSDPTVKDEIKNCALTGKINKERLRAKILSFKGMESLELFNQNLDDACRVMNSVIKEILSERELIIFSNVQSTLENILINQDVMLRRLNEIPGETTRSIVSGLMEGVPSKQYPKELVNENIEDAIDLLRKSRFFVEFDRVRNSLILANKIDEGELSGGSAKARSRALAWCARILSMDEIKQAEIYLEKAKMLDTSSETEIACAFILSHKGEKSAPLDRLAKINTPESRTASLMIVANNEGNKKALEWLEVAKINFIDFDSEGKHHFISLLLERGKWEDAMDCLGDLYIEDFQMTPVLHHDFAMANLVSTVPNDFRGVVLKVLPFQLENFPLASDQKSLDARRSAHKHFKEIVKIGEELDLPKAKTVADEYALWLELRDPDNLIAGKERLMAKLNDIKTALRLVPMALQFGIDLDTEIVEREIEREIALNGGMTPAAAMARFALVFKQESPGDGAAYISLHFDHLKEYIDCVVLYSIQIELYAKAGQIEKAKKTLDILVENGVPDVEEERLLQIINIGKGVDPKECLKEHFRKTDSLADLLSLVDHLEDTKNWQELKEYGEVLFNRTNALRDAVRFAGALYNLNQQQSLLSFCKDNISIVDQSKDLQILYCWSLFLEGRLIDAKMKLADLEKDWNNEKIRRLHIELNIAMGQWDSLAPIVSHELENKDNRSAGELLEATLLAFYIESSCAKELLFAAVNKGADDAQILASAYFLASKAGWEENAGVIDWLHEAARLSDKDGPVMKASIREIVEMKPDWDRRESETWEQYQCGKIFIFMAAQLLNKSLVDLFLFPALANQFQFDPRRRVVIPAYSGKNQKRPLILDGSAGFGPTALITLSLLNILEISLDAFKKVIIPHSTLSWLFDEKQKATFHQPSQIVDAHVIRNLLATNAIKEMTPSAIPESDLAVEVGEELALLIAEAKNKRDNDRLQSFVVRPYPVYIVATMMEEEADLSAYNDVLSSCQAIVDKLKQNGQITAAEHQKAQDYLKLQEKPWPKQPEIVDNSLLYLDDLAVSHLLHLGLFVN